MPRNKFFNISIVLSMILGVTVAGIAQKTDKEAPLTGTPVLWEPVNIRERDTYWGPGGREMFPVLDGITYVGRQVGGNNLKFRLREKSGREWVVKAADESQPEVAAGRLLWAIGYPTEVDYMVPRLAIRGTGNYKNVRFEARPEGVNRGGRWSWDSNPFQGSKEYAGLRVMMAMVNNWDLKDENTVIMQKDGKLYYAVSDLGSSFGKLAQHSRTRAGRSVNVPEDYAGSVFISGVKGGNIQFAYTGYRTDLMTGITTEHARWLSDLLAQLSDKQIEDAFRAANYSPEDVAILATAFKARRSQLDKAARQLVAGN